MANYHDDLGYLRGRVLVSRPEASPDFVGNALNDRIRQILDEKIFWADLLKFGILSFPDPYTTGTVSLTTGSKVVSGAGMTWPVADLVNTTIPDGVSEYGYVEVTPASMQGITANSILYVDGGGDPEAVPVVETSRASFIGIFTKQHNTGCSVTASSLANQQFRMTSPIFTVQAVTSPTTLQLDMAWGAASVSSQTYRIQLMYVTLATDLKAIIAAKDEQTSWPLALHIPLEEVNARDPRRAAVGTTGRYGLVDLGANPQGNMIHEVYPAPSTARQFSYAYFRQWPDMVKDTDRPPPFINPTVLYYGATADAKMHRTKRDDPYYDPVGAKWYESKFEEGRQAAKNANEAKVLEALRNPWWQGVLPGGFDQAQLNDPSVMGFWGGEMTLY